MSTRVVKVFCDDCPYPSTTCDTYENKCDIARWVKKVTDEAPPLTRSQIAKIVAILSVRYPDPAAKNRRLQK